MMLKLENIHKSFSNGAGDKVKALTDINLTVEKGDFLVVVGSNGSGKSTLLNLIAGSLFPDTGKIELNGKRIEKRNDYQRAAHISRIFQDPAMGTAPGMRIIENFRLAALRRQKRTLMNGMDRKFRNEIAERIGELGFGLEHKLDQPVGQLSGGQRQALALLMAIIDPPEILLLDEPTAALDPKAAKMVIQVANTYIAEKKLTTIFVTHNMQEAVMYGNRLIQMHQGQIKRDLRKDDIRDLDAAKLIQWFGETV